MPKPTPKIKSVQDLVDFWTGLQAETAEYATDAMIASLSHEFDLSFALVADGRAVEIAPESSIGTGQIKRLYFPFSELQFGELIDAFEEEYVRAFNSV